MPEKEKIASVTLYRLEDKVTFEGETCTVIGVEDGGSSAVHGQQMRFENPNLSGHPQRLRLRDPHGNVIYPVSGANCSKIV